MPYTLTENPHMSDDDYKNFVIMNKSNHSYAVNRQITEIFHNRSWAGQPCFIIGGGLSIKGFDFSRLAKFNTIGINKSFLHFSPTINYAMDSDFYDAIYDGRYDEQEGCKVLEKWQAYTGPKVFLTPMEFKEFQGRDIYLVRREWRPSVNIGELDAGIYGGINSATGALNLAFTLGCREIYLLGYDMFCTTQSHWHAGYPNRDLADFNTKLGEYRAEIEKLAPLWAANGAVILNLNLLSGLKCFPFGNLDRILGALDAHL